MRPSAARFALGAAIFAAMLQGRADAEEPADPVAASAQERFRHGRDAFNRKDYATALKDFEAAQVIKPAPALDYNIGLCLDGLGRLPEAIASYRRFLANGPNGAEADQTRARLKELEGRLPAAAPPRPVEPPRPASPEPRAAEPAPVATPPTAASTEQAAAPSSGWSLRRKVGVGVAAGGGAIALAGAALLIVATVGAGSVNDVTTLALRDDRISAVSGERIGGGVLVGVGGAALIAGVVLALLPGGERAQAFYVAPNGLGLAAGGAF